MPIAKKFSIVLINLTVFPLLVIMTIIGILISPFAFLCFKIFGNLDTVRIIRIFVWIYGRGWLAIVKPFTGLELTGFKKGDIRTPCIIVPNHLSFFDTFFMGALPLLMYVLPSVPGHLKWHGTVHL